MQKDTYYGNIVQKESIRRLSETDPTDQTDQDGTMSISEDYETYVARQKKHFDAIETTGTRTDTPAPITTTPTSRSGGGYHFLQPLYADLVLEMESVFAEFVEPSRKLMQYAEKMVTDKKGDLCHCNIVSFNNCMIRIPGSYNSKYIEFDDMRKIVNISSESEVKIVQRWDGCRANFRWLLKDYWIYLIQERNNEILKRTHDEQKRLKFERGYPNYIIDNQQTSKIDWIESLYAKPLDDFRKYCIWRIFTPYLMNVRKLSRSDVFNRIMNWLDRCSSECRHLDFRPQQKINESLDRVKKYRPVSKERLKIENEPLYLRLKTEGIYYE